MSLGAQGKVEQSIHQATRTRPPSSYKTCRFAAVAEDLDVTAAASAMKSMGSASGTVFAPAGATPLFTDFADTW